MKTNVSAQLLVVLALLITTVIVVVPSVANASGNQSPDGRGLQNYEYASDSTVILVEHGQHMDELWYEAALAARWIAMADFYARNGLLTNDGAPDATVVFVEHRQHMNELGYEAALAARQP